MATKISDLDFVNMKSVTLSTESGSVKLKARKDKEHFEYQEAGGSAGGGSWPEALMKVETETGKVLAFFDGEKIIGVGDVKYFKSEE
jgi:hypothetical protein